MSQLKNFLVIFILLIGLMPVNNTYADDTEQSMEIIQINVNNELLFDSEILILNDKIYAPARQIGEIVDIVFEFNRGARKLSFTDMENSDPVEIDYLNSSIKVGTSVLDQTANRIFKTEEAFVISTEDILVDISLLSKLFNIALEYDADNLVLALNVERQIEILKKTIKYKDRASNEIEYIQPNKEKFSFRTFQVSLNSNASKQFDNTTSTDQEVAIDNTANLGIVGEIAGGEYRVGPSLSLSPERGTITGFQQTWTKKVNDNFAIELGNTGGNMGELTLPGTNVVGLRMGTADRLSFATQETIAFEGNCDVDSEVLLMLNDSQIARQICTEGNYNFTNIPRVSNPDNRYAVVQNGTDGTQTILRDEVLSFFSDLLAPGEQEWEVVAGKLPKQQSIRLFGEKTQASTPADKMIFGGMYRRGISERLNMGISASYDPLLSKDDSTNSAPLTNDLSSFYNEYTHSGLNGSFSLDARPTNNLGLHWETAISSSKDGSSTQQYRDGFGWGSFLDYNYRNDKFSSQGRFYYLDSNYYSSSGVEPNRLGMNFSSGFALGKNQFNFNYQGEQRNVDELSKGTKNIRQTYNLTHNTQLGERVTLRNNVNYKNSTYNNNTSGALRTRTALAYRVNKNLRTTFSSGANYIQTGEEISTAKFSNADMTAGFSYRLPNKDQISGSASYYTDGQQGIYAQYRKQMGDFVYEPSFDLTWGKAGNTQFTLGNGLYYQHDNGMRIGAQYIYSRAGSPTNSTSLASAISQNITQNHSFLLSSIFSLGYFDGDAYLLGHGANSGYLKGNVFLDLNENGTQDEGEDGVADIKVCRAGKKQCITSNAEGKFVMADVPQGLHEADLDTEEIPFLLSVLGSEKEYFKIDKGKVTEVQYRLIMNAATVSGTIMVADVTGKEKSGENIAVIAYNLDEDREVAYTYTDSDGYYMLSELKPGKYKIAIDKGDIEHKNFKPKDESAKLEYIIDIPVNFDDFIEIEDLNFNLLRTLF